MTSDELSARMTTFDKCVIERDVDLARTVLDDDYMLVIAQPALVAMPRDRWLEVLPDYVVHDYAVESQRVDVDGDIAAVLQTVSMQATVLGQDRSGAFVTSDIWRLRGANWRIWRRHSTPFSAGPIPVR
jgi:ketosteroid isomerase-like protein